MPDLGKYLTELPEALTLDDDDILYTVVGSGTATSKKVKKSTILSADRTARATAEGTIVANFASPYSTITQYAVGDYCIKDLVLYKCISPTSGTWDSSKWMQVTALDLTSGVASDLADEIEARQSADEALQGEIDELPVDVQVDGGTLVNEDNIAVLDSLVAYGEASGEIATFSDGSDLAMKSLKVAIEPQQDLHGYDAPWVGGSGKNKFQTIATSKTEGGVTWTVNSDGTVTVSGTATEYSSLALGDAKVNSSMGNIVISGIGGTTNIAWGGVELRDSNNNVLLVVASGGTYSYFTVDLSQYPTAYRITMSVKRNNNGAVSGVIKPQVELGQAVTTYEPYSNICPISGWDECNVTRCGKNLFDKTTAVSRYFINSFGVETFNANMARSDYIRVKSNTTYYTNADATGMFYIIALYDEYKNFIKIINLASPTNFNTENATYVIINTAPAKTSIDDMYVIEGSTASSYEPYNGHTYTIDLDGTRYGGTLDVVSGMLTVDWIGVDLGSLTWNGSLSAYHYYTTLSIPYKWANNTQFICSKYKFDGRGTGGNYYGANGTFRYWYSEGGTQVYEIYVCDETHTFSSFTEVKEYLSGTTLVYELATPQTIQLTPTQVKSLLGINNVWADCGDVDVSYVRDLTTTINYILEQLEG